MMIRRFTAALLAAALAAQTAAASYEFRAMSNESRECSGVLNHQLITRHSALGTVFDDQALAATSSCCRNLWGRTHPFISRLLAGHGRSGAEIGSRERKIIFRDFIARISRGDAEAADEFSLILADPDADIHIVIETIMVLGFNAAAVAPVLPAGFFENLGMFLQRPDLHPVVLCAAVISGAVLRTHVPSESSYRPLKIFEDVLSHPLADRRVLAAALCALYSFSFGLPEWFSDDTIRAVNGSCANVSAEGETRSLAGLTLSALARQGHHLAFECLQELRGRLPQAEPAFSLVQRALGLVDAPVGLPEEPLPPITDLIIVNDFEARQQPLLDALVSFVDGKGTIHRLQRFRTTRRVLNRRRNAPAHVILTGGRLNDCLRRQIEQIMKETARGPAGTKTVVTMPLGAVSMAPLDNIDVAKNGLAAALAAMSNDQSVAGFIVLGQIASFNIEPAVKVTIAENGRILRKLNPAGTREMILNFVSDEALLWRMLGRDAAADGAQASRKVAPGSPLGVFELLLREDRPLSKEEICRFLERKPSTLAPDFRALVNHLGFAEWIEEGGVKKIRPTCKTYLGIGSALGVLEDLCRDGKRHYRPSVAELGEAKENYQTLRRRESYEMRPYEWYTAATGMLLPSVRAAKFLLLRLASHFDIPESVESVLTNWEAGTYEQFLSYIVQEERLLPEIRLYAHGLLDPRENDPRVVELSRQLLQSRHALPVGTLITENFPWWRMESWRDELVKVYALAVLNVMLDELGRRQIVDPGRCMFIRSAIMKKTRFVRLGYGDANADFHIDPVNILRKYTNCGTLFNGLGHEIGHNILTLIQGQTKPIGDVLHELISYMTGYAVSIILGCDQDINFSRGRFRLCFEKMRVSDTSQVKDPDHTRAAAAVYEFLTVLEEASPEDALGRFVDLWKTALSYLFNGRRDIPSSADLDFEHVRQFLLDKARHGLKAAA
jgi:hypothetical protein